MDSLHEFAIPADCACWQHALAVFEMRLCSNVLHSVCTVTCLEALDARNAARKVAPKNSEARVSASSCL